MVKFKIYTFVYQHVAQCYGHMWHKYLDSPEKLKVHTINTMCVIYMNKIGKFSNISKL